MVWWADGSGPSQLKVGKSNHNGQKAGRLLQLRLVPLGGGTWDLLKQNKPGSLAAPCLQHCVMPASGPLGHDNKRLSFFFPVYPGCQEGGLAVSERFPRDKYQ